MIPTFQDIMLPFLKSLENGKEKTIQESFREMALHFKVTDDEFQSRFGKSGGLVFPNRVRWAKAYLKQAGLIRQERRGSFFITESGRKILSEKHEKIDIKLLESIPKFIEGRKRSESENPTSTEEKISRTVVDGNDLTPEEIIEGQYAKITARLAEDLLEKITQQSPAFFERLVVDLMVKMGYGGSFEDVEKALVTGKSGDEGIDGVIKEDFLGLDRIYLQAKRWKNNISNEEIERFSGSLLRKKASKGVFVTTSEFTNPAIRAAKEAAPQIIVLIDGKRLAELMIRYGLGVSSITAYEIKRIDSDYFSEE